MQCEGANGMFSRFERISVIGYVGKRGKLEWFNREMERVGINCFHTHWLVDTPLDTIATNAISLDFHPRYFSVTMGHYYEIKVALGLGCSSVLIMEDDARFPLDLSELRKGIDLLPDDFDLALLDSFPEVKFNQECHDLLLHNKVNEVWCKGVVKRCSSACYALSQRGMKRAIQIYEDAIVGKNKMRCSDQMFLPYFWNGLNYYVAFPNLAIQCETPNTTSKYSTIRTIYRDEKIDESKYASAIGL